MGVRVPPFAYQPIFEYIMECHTYCTAFSFNLKALHNYLQSQYKTSFDTEVVYIELESDTTASNAFFFAYGSVTLWNISKESAEKLLNEIKPFANIPSEAIEYECFTYQYGDKPSFKDDIIILPDDHPATKTAFSHCLAQSIKLRAFEAMIQKTFEAAHYLPEHLAKHGNIPLSRRQTRKKIGQLFIERSSINLRLNILKTPKFFWENPEFEDIYLMMASELDIEIRTSALNKQLDVLHDLFEMLGNELNHQHSSRLEWAIIFLIIIEVGLLFFHDVLKWI